MTDLVKRLRKSHDAFAILEGVDNDDLVNVLDAASALEAREGWRPIETAPKDGTPILSWATPSRRPVYHRAPAPVGRLRYERARGETFEEMRENLTDHLYDQGDTVLVWANEGDLCELDFVALASPVAGEPPVAEPSHDGNDHTHVEGAVDTKANPPQIVVDAYLGILVLRTMCKAAKLSGGVEASDQLLARMTEKYPSLPALSALRASTGEGR